MFIGREYEINALNKLYSKEEFQFIVMYGRRRVGKTTLLSEFCNNKPAIFFVAEEYNSSLSLRNFSKQILEYFKMTDYISTFESWEKAFMFLAKESEDKQLILVVDEFPYLVQSNNTLPSLLQNLIDHYLKKTKLFIVVCGSSMSFMEKEVLSYKSPLFGRRTAQMLIEPFDFYNSSKFFPKYSFNERVMTYGIIGGIPQYLEKFNEKNTIEDNIKQELLDKSSYLYEEPKNLLKQELREPAVYNSIIEAIANGYTKINEISTKIGEPKDKCSKYLSSLIDLHIVSKETPIMEKENSRKSIYKLNDNLFKFYYNFIFSNKSLIEQHMGDFLYEKKIEPQIPKYLGEIFEKVCIDFMNYQNRNGDLPFIYTNIGRWWGNNPKTKKQEEIDIVAIDDTMILFGECKWRNEKLDMDVVNSLIKKSEINVFEKFQKKFYSFFSKSGFTDSVKDYSNNNKNILLFGPEELIGD
ncbi:hypothetical protein B0P06_002518 [Clostridium saccharoperbutylacetonicum]|uniref:Putative ATPase n=2 Tax=Clostridium saccharoperbutylacetonicum TaxID=36745 RepID=M1MSN2_9CLOT|nr:ATP-binding protein [Clostridium saccharoperbutylacetonicum]AGF59148.1 putative ATPase [Clostridium saccharoperbutylacetonicum N1-4(HMT)]NRT60065.1 hypothetical protein [Clostridium saccharoperbutylacetonicum]NSB23377.1 hypothetical protein [Clostridium saccharoperbutylacetonicum]NSB42747.1 hypothetical protein [Clostridium saccharoperbutylacetonicum]